MALDDAHDDASDAPDPQESFIRAIEAKYAGDDAKLVRQIDGMEEEEDAGQDSTAAGDGDSEGTAGDTAKGTSATNPDGDGDESGDDPDDGDDDGHTDGDDPDEPDGDNDALEGDDAAEKDEEGDDDAEDAATKAALAAKGADLTLEDVPEEFRPIIQKKLKGIDAAFTKVQMEQTAFRAERTEYLAERRFAEENPELAIVETIREALKKDPELFDKINARFDTLDDATQAEAFEIVLKDKRKEAAAKVTSEVDQYRARVDRGYEVESYAQDQARKLNVPWRLAERAVEAALLRKPVEARDITNEEIDAIVAAEARELRKEERARGRDKSKTVVVKRVEATKKDVPARRAPSGAAPPRPGAEKVKRVDFDSEDSRLEAIMGTARRVLPGLRDR